ncbi:MAG: radical SAM protein [Candidatus Pacearchaeota archaeon]
MQKDNLSKRKKILFIESPLSSSKEIQFPNHQIPLGFLYMAGVLEKNGFEVKVLDCPLYYNLKKYVDENTIRFGLYPEKIEEFIEDFNPDIIGVSCSFTMFEKDSFDVIDLIKKINKNILVVVGGAHTSANPEFVLRNKNIDLAVIGEGELTMLEIAQRFQNSKSLTNIDGTALMVNNKIKINRPRKQIEDLDELEPAWHLINFNDYFNHPDNSAVVIRSPSANIITSRGCPGQCVFCSIHTVWGRRWRAMSAKKVVNQIEFLSRKYGVKHFRINDDNLTLNKKRIIEICNEIIHRKLDIKWDTPSGVAFWTLDEEVLYAMKKAGYYRISFGIESGCKETIKYINKNIDLKKVNELINYCHKIGLWVASFFIIGFPFEKEKEVKDSINYIIKSKINFPFIFVAQPYMGTKLYEDFKNSGLLEKGFEDTSSFIKTKYRTKYFSSEELNEIRKYTYIKFYLMRVIRYSNPYLFYREFLSKIKSKEDIRYVGRIIKNLLTLFLY